LRGKSWKVFATGPPGDTIPLIRINQWDFHWQSWYTFPTPVVLDSGSVMHGIAGYDNTVNNHDNPHNPPVDVNYGFGSEDEMMVVFFKWVHYRNGDDTLQLWKPEDDTTAILALEPAQAEEPLRFWPNPTNGTVFFNTGPPTSQSREVPVFNTKMEIVQHCTVEGSLPQSPLALEDLPPSIYLVRIVSLRDGKRWFGKVMRE